MDFSRLLNPLLGGIAGGFQGLAQQQQLRQEKARQDLLTNRQLKSDRIADEDRQRTLDADRVLGQYLRPALSGDETAQAEVIRVRPELAARFVKPDAAPRTQYDADRGGVVNVDTNTFTPTPGLRPKEVPFNERNTQAIQSRIKQLVAQRVPLEQANRQARMEFGEAPPQPQQPSFTPVTLGNEVKPFNTRTGETGEAIGEAKTPAGQGNASRSARIQAIANTSDALDRFEETLSSIGSTIMPGSNKDVLRTAYEDVQLQMKEMYNLGVLNGPDLALMRRILRDPSDVSGRALAFGSGDEQTRRSLAQVGQVRRALLDIKTRLEQGNAAISQPGRSGDGRSGGNPNQQQPSGNSDLGGQPQPLTTMDIARARQNSAYANWLRDRGYQVP